MCPDIFPAPIAEPADLAELAQRARQLAGRRLGELAHWAKVELPDNLAGNKGCVGQLLERLLGASSGNRAEPDFAHLGVELKTLPVDFAGRPLESTYVTIVPLRHIDSATWETSVVRKKLKHVLWLPVLAERSIPLKERIVGQAFFWQPSDEEEALLCADWDYHLRRIRDGGMNAIRGADGAILQIRPKASTALDYTQITLPEHGTMLTRPAGFYLRSVFTRYLLERYFHGADPDAAMKTLSREISAKF